MSKRKQNSTNYCCYFNSFIQFFSIIIIRVTRLCVYRKLWFTRINFWQSNISPIKQLIEPNWVRWAKPGSYFTRIWPIEHCFQSWQSSSPSTARLAVHAWPLGRTVDSRGQYLHRLTYNVIPTWQRKKDPQLAMPLWRQRSRFPLLEENAETQCKVKFSLRCIKGFCCKQQYCKYPIPSLQIIHFFRNWMCLQCWDINCCWRKLLCLVPWVSKDSILVHCRHHICAIPVILRKHKLWWEQLFTLRYLDFIVSYNIYPSATIQLHLSCTSTDTRCWEIKAATVLRIILQSLGSDSNPS